MLLLFSVLAFGSAADDNLAKEERELFFASVLRTLFFPSLTEEAAEKKERVASSLFAGRSLLLSVVDGLAEEERNPCLPVPPGSAKDWDQSCSSFAGLFLHMSCSAFEL
jgi:hypothetical protein